MWVYVGADASHHHGTVMSGDVARARGRGLRPGHGLHERSLDRLFSAASTLLAADLNEAHVKLEHIGNEIDHWKGAVLGELQQKELLNDLVVDAMARYDEPWTDRDLARYADVLRLRGPEQIARHEEPWGKGKRTPYFAELNRHASHDFFPRPRRGRCNQQGDT